jgi:dihydrofolate reductase
MARLIYSGIMSLDGFIADEHGEFDWSAPTEEVHAFVNERERPVGTYLYGRRMYDVMVAWEDFDLSEQPPVARDYAEIWRAADKVVYSTTLAAPASARTRVERHFDADAVRRLKAAATSDISIGGPELASHAIRAGLVDEYQFFLSPVIVGGGVPFLPPGSKAGVRLLDERRFSNGVVYLRYEAR